LVSAGAVANSLFMGHLYNPAENGIVRDSSDTMAEDSTVDQVRWEQIAQSSLQVLLGDCRDAGVRMV